MTADIRPARDIRIEGAATLLSSLAHGGESAGTVAYMRREKIISAEGRPMQVPVVSGNALRGILRDNAAKVFWRSLGSPALPTPVFDLLWSGGALAKAGSGHVLSTRQLAEVRQMVPLVSVFGGSGAGKIIEGKLRVGKLTPICAETSHIVPEGIAGEDPASVWDMLQIEEFTRRDDAKRDQLHAAIESSVDKDGVLVPVEQRDVPQQMRYGVETLAAGARLHWWMTLRDVTDVECAMIGQALDAWITDGAHIGGRSATGHGRLRLDVAEWSTVTPSATVGDALARAGVDDLTAHAEAHRDQILECLSWFAS